MFVTDIECGGGFYVRSLVDDLGKGEPTSCWLVLWFFTDSRRRLCCSGGVLRSREGADPDQAGPVHPGGARPAGGAMDPGAHPALPAALLSRSRTAPEPLDSGVFGQRSCWFGSAGSDPLRLLVLYLQPPDFSNKEYFTVSD